MAFDGVLRVYQPEPCQLCLIGIVLKDRNSQLNSSPVQSVEFGRLAIYSGQALLLVGIVSPNTKIIALISSRPEFGRYYFKYMPEAAP